MAFKTKDGSTSAWKQIGKVIDALLSHWYQALHYFSDKKGVA
nr:hypothetical protein [Lactobacillus helveticus]